MRMILINILLVFIGVITDVGVVCKKENPDYGGVVIPDWDGPELFLGFCRNYPRLVNQ